MPNLLTINGKKEAWGSGCGSPTLGRFKNAACVNGVTHRFLPAEVRHAQAGHPLQLKGADDLR